LAIRNITVEGEVQHVGFRNLVEDMGQLNELEGFVENSKNGTVKIVAGGPEKDIDEFVQGIREMGKRSGIDVKNIKESKVEGDPHLPSPFTKAPTDELSDIRDKLDEGVHALKEIKEDTEEMTDITKNLNDMKQILENIEENS